MVILVDMDDTIEQLLKAWLAVINQKHGRNVECEDIVDWNMALAYPGLTHEEVYDVIKQPGFWGSVEPIPGAAEALQRLIAAGHEVYIVTATDYESVPEKMGDLLFRWFPFLSWDHVIITSNKQMIRGDVLIDDGIHNLEGGEYAKILVTAPYNRDYDAEAHGMIRVHNWTEIEEAIRRLATGQDC